MASLPTRPLGDSGIDVSVVGLGCNNFGRRIDFAATREVIDAAISEGTTFFDTSNTYGRGESERFIGELLKGRRDRVVLATKFGMDMGDGREPRGSRDYIRQAIDASLQRLQTDAVDYYWYHEPDGVTPILETLETLRELVTAGKVRAIGASNFSAAQLDEADAVAREHGLTRFSAVQNEYSLLVREAEQEVLPACERLGISFIPYFPLASGLLTGKYRSGVPAPGGTRLSGRDEVATPAQFALLDSLRGYAEQRGISLTDVAIGALLARPVVASVIAGATKAEQVRANAAAARWTAGDADLAELTELLGAAAA